MCCLKEVCIVLFIAEVRYSSRLKVVVGGAYFFVFRGLARFRNASLTSSFGRLCSS